MIHIQNVKKVISKKEVLTDINLQLNERDCVLLRGQNGCGKTMLLRLISGLIQPTEGSVKSDCDYRFGVIIENPTFFLHETALYNLRYLANINHRITNQDIEIWLKRVNLFEDRYTRVGKYSLGMKQRLAICQAVMENPDVILLDEPFNALDETNLNMVYELIDELREQGKIIVIASHGDSIHENIFNKVIKMDSGKISSIQQL